MPGEIEKYLTAEHKGELKGRYKLLRVIMDLIEKLFALGAAGEIRMAPLLKRLEWAAEV